MGARYHSGKAAARCLPSYFVSMMRDLQQTVIGQLSKKRLTSGAFFLKVELFSTFFTLGAGEKNAERGV